MVTYTEADNDPVGPFYFNEIQWRSDVIYVNIIGHGLMQTKDLRMNKDGYTAEVFGLLSNQLVKVKSKFE